MTVAFHRGVDDNVDMPDTVSAAAPELTVSSLTVCYGAITVLEDVSLTMRSGEVVALAGENGAGKTTLIRAIAGDVAPASGSVRLGGRPVPPDPMAAARLGIRIVWQDLALLDHLDVASNVMLGNERRRDVLSEVALHKEASRVLTRLGIPLPDTTRKVGSLSGGQRQMVAVARAMAHDPRLLLLDETMASLGATEAALVERLISRVRERGTTILLSGHGTELMFRLADRIVVLRHGRVLTEVSPGEVHPGDLPALISGQPADSAGQYADLALQALRRGLAADETALVTRSRDGAETVRGYAGAAAISPGTLAAARAALAGDGRDVPRDERFFFVTFTVRGGPGPEGRAVLLAAWASGRRRREYATDLLEDAAHSLRIVLEREPREPREPRGYSYLT